MTSGSAENSFFDYSKFEAMTSLSGGETARSDEDQFCAKVINLAIFEFYCRLTSGLNKARIQKKNGTFATTHTFAFSYLPRHFWATI